jgi:hypothetical protein
VRVQVSGFHNLCWQSQIRMFADGNGTFPADQTDIRPSPPRSHRLASNAASLSAFLRCLPFVCCPPAMSSAEHMDLDVASHLDGEHRVRTCSYQHASVAVYTYCALAACIQTTSYQCVGCLFRMLGVC